MNHKCEPGCSNVNHHQNVNQKCEPPLKCVPEMWTTNVNPHAWNVNPMRATRCVYDKNISWVAAESDLTNNVTSPSGNSNILVAALPGPLPESDIVRLTCFLHAIKVYREVYHGNYIMRRIWLNGSQLSWLSASGQNAFADLTAFAPEWHTLTKSIHYVAIYGRNIYIGSPWLDMSSYF